MAETNFNRQEAESWINVVTDLNREAQELLDKVTQCLQEIKSESKGPFVDTLYQVGSQLMPKFADLISSLNNLITALKDIINKFQDFADAVVDGIKTAAKAMVGGLTV